MVRKKELTEADFEECAVLRLRHGLCNPLVFSLALKNLHDLHWSPCWQLFTWCILVHDVFLLKHLFSVCVLGKRIHMKIRTMCRSNF